MTSPQSRRLKRHFVGGLPLLHRLAERIGLRALLERYVPTHGNDQVPVVDTLMLLVYNLTLGKDPVRSNNSYGLPMVILEQAT